MDGHSHYAMRNNNEDYDGVFVMAVPHHDIFNDLDLPWQVAEAEDAFHLHAIVRQRLKSLLPDSLAEQISYNKCTERGTIIILKHKEDKNHER